MAARVESQAGGTDDGVATSIPSAFKNKLMLGVTEAIMWIACRRHFSHETIREHLERRARNLRRHTGSKEKPCLQVSPALSNRVDKAEFQLFRLIIGGVPAIGTLDDEGDPKHQKRVPVPVEFLKDGAYTDLLSGHIRADPLLEKHSGYQRPTYLEVGIDRDTFFKALAAAEPRRKAPPATGGRHSEPDEKTHRPPDNAVSTAEKQQGGRPSLATESLAAYDNLVESEKIVHPTTKVATYPIIRERVCEMFPGKVEAARGRNDGLGNEAIRTAIRARFDENEAKAKPPTTSP